MLQQTTPIDVLRPPIRRRRDRLIQNKDDELVRAVELASAKLGACRPSAKAELILILFDADNECPGQVGPRTIQIATNARKDKNIACVVANVEYETWFVAAAESLTDHLDLSGDKTLTANPEAARHGKGWIEKRFRGVKYSATIDQPKLTAKFDLQRCRQRSPSFDKLCREIERFIASEDNQRGSP